MKWIKRLWWVLPALLILVGVAFFLWASAAAKPMPEALAALESDASVQVKTDPWLVFRPVDSDPTVGLILYPGGRVDPRAYAPTARAVAEEGHLVVIVPMPLNLAVFAPSRAAEVMAAFPGIERWAVGGLQTAGKFDLWHIGWIGNAGPDRCLAPPAAAGHAVDRHRRWEPRPVWLVWAAVG
jgi:hypothetical protein